MLPLSDDQPAGHSKQTVEAIVELRYSPTLHGAHPVPASPASHLRLHMHKMIEKKKKKNGERENKERTCQLKPSNANNAKNKQVKNEKLTYHLALPISDFSPIPHLEHTVEPASLLFSLMEHNVQPV